MNWLEDIIKVLRNPKYTQIQGSLEEIGVDGKISGKCALGELRCNKKADTYDICGSDHIIMRAFDVPEELYRNLPELDTDSGDDHNNPNFNFKADYDWDYDGIQDYIWKLNDAGFTYDQIASFLETTFGT